MVDVLLFLCVAALLVLLWSPGEIDGSLSHRVWEGQGGSCFSPRPFVSWTAFPPRPKSLSLSSRSLAALQEPALLCVVLPRGGDAGEHADATHHAEIQGQPGRGPQRQPQPGGFHQGWHCSQCLQWFIDPLIWRWVWKTALRLRPRELYLNRPHCRWFMFGD